MWSSAEVPSRVLDLLFSTPSRHHAIEMGLESKLRLKKPDSKSRPENEQFVGQVGSTHFCSACEGVPGGRKGLEGEVGVGVEEGREGGPGRPWDGHAVGLQFWNEPALKTKEPSRVQEE